MSLVNENGGVPAVMNVTPTGTANGGNCGGWGGDWDTGGYGVHGSGCICPHAAGRDKQFRIGEYTWKCSLSGWNGNPVILWVRLAVIRQDQKGGHERADGGIIKHMERRMEKTGNNKKTP